ncbi:MAG: adenylyl-sulfate kinase [Bacteroidota bacterium]|jgi:adenylylsulfate kinase
MLLFQMTGLSGAGKSTIANLVKENLLNLNLKVEIIDGDEFRKTLCADLGFSQEDRIENIKRLGFVANLLARNEIITIIAAINPYNLARNKLQELYNAKLIYIKCDVETLRQRDTKGLYKRAFLPENHPEKIHNLTGVNDIFEIPQNADLVIDTTKESLEVSLQRVLDFIMENNR